MAQLGPGGSPPVPNPQAPPPQRPWLRIGVMAALVGLYVLFLVFQSPLGRSVGGSSRETITYSQLKTQIAADNVKDLTIQGQDAWGDFANAVSVDGAASNSQFSTTVPATDPSIYPLLDQYHVKYEYKQDNGGLGSLLINFLPFLLLIGFWIWILRRSGQATQGIFSFGRSRARMQAPGSPKTTFQDVAGVEQAQFELQEIVDFLRDPQRFQRLEFGQCHRLLVFRNLRARRLSGLL